MSPRFLPFKKRNNSTCTTVLQKRVLCLDKTQFFLKRDRHGLQVMSQTLIKVHQWHFQTKFYTVIQITTGKVNDSFPATRYCGLKDFPTTDAFVRGKTGSLQQWTNIHIKIQWGNYYLLSLQLHKICKCELHNCICLISATLQQGSSFNKQL